MSTVSTRAQDVTRKHFCIDADGKILGRLATKVASILRGKHKPEFTPHVDTGDYVIIINAAKVKVTGNKMSDKIYYHHSRFPGGIKSINLEKALDTKPEMVLERAIKGMLPKNPLGRAMYRKLKIYADNEHPHQAQQPEMIENL